MGAKEITKTTRWLSLKQLVEEKVVPWSKDTVRRRMEEEGFPYIQDTGGPLFDVEDVKRWMKQRKRNV